VTAAPTRTETPRRRIRINAIAVSFVKGLNGQSRLRKRNAKHFGKNQVKARSLVITVGEVAECSEISLPLSHSATPRKIAASTWRQHDREHQRS